MIFRTYYEYLEGWSEELLPFDHFYHKGTSIEHVGFCVTVSNGVSEVFNFPSHHEACFYAHCAAAKVLELPPHWKEMGFTKNPFALYLICGQLEIERHGSNFVVWFGNDIIHRGDELGARLIASDEASWPQRLAVPAHQSYVYPLPPQ